uniref:Ycf33 n=1 Tax=Thalassionema bacillare TaxID=426664 RepID=UPI001EDF3EF2|nr:Ycf33 [Thalassionema bacillare]UHY40474.1 Ycf33 [Thalassionema bacillare]UHY40861.1 Ycf33 [Thalassionema bacillare]UHY41119.1 Ycf33 [Thalassionema bacillare]
MEDFWKNIIRYPRFFLSSLTGLILVIITPLRNLLKIPKLRIFAISLILIIILSIFIIIQKMTCL